MEQSQCLCPNCPVRWNRAILIVRDARSVLCSYYHFQKRLGNFEGGFSQFIRDKDASGYGYDYVQWLKSWLDQNSTLVYMIKYEDLVSDAVATLEPVFRDFLKVDVARAVLERAIAENDFESMKRKEIRDGGGRLFRQAYPDAVKSGFALLRKGQKGGDAVRECFDIDGEDEEFLEHILGWREFKDKLLY